MGGVVQNIRMYRKYVLKRTHVINSHNYLLEAQQAETNHHCLFHQLLISSHSLPSLKDTPDIEKLIGQSQNQNSVNQTSNGFQFYLEKNLLQIRLKEGVKPITDITTLSIKQILTLVNSLNVDFAISVKQMRSMARHNQSAYSNAIKFFSLIALRERPKELILPLIDGQQIHFYDLYYQEAFCSNREKEKEQEERRRQGAFKKRLSQKKIKRKSQMSEELFLDDETVFRRYLHFLTSLFFHKNIVQFLQDLQMIGEGSSSQTLKRLQIMGNKSSDKTEKMLLELFFRCVSCDSEYSLSIFVKECQILIDKHEKLQQGHPSEKKLGEGRFIGEDKLKTSKSCLALNKQLRAELSLHHQDRPSIPMRESQKRLKVAKSLINLKPNKSTATAKSRTLKNGSIFSKSKEKLNDKTNIFQQSLTTINKQKGKILASSQSGSFMMGNSASSNWFNQSALPNQSLIKLRNFKKGNNFNTTASHTPDLTQNQFRNQASSNLRNTAPENEVSLEIEKACELQLGRLGRMIRKESVKAEPKEVAKVEKAVLDDKYTMTEQFEEPIEQIKEQKQKETEVERRTTFQETVEPQQSKEEKNKKQLKRQIVSTFNLKFGEQPNKKVEIKMEDEKKQVSKQIKPVQEPKATPKMTKNTESIIKKEQPSKKQPQTLIPPQKKPSTEVTTKELPKPKKVQAKRQSVVDDDQFEQITFTKKQVPKINKKVPQSIKNNSVLLQKQKQVQSKTPKAPKQVKQPQIQIPCKLTMTILPEDHKKILNEHFAYQINFYTQHFSKLKQLPQNNNLIFIMYHIYYRTLLQNKSLGLEYYKQVIGILVKKQQKMNMGDKDIQLYKNDPQTLWGKAKAIRAIEENLSKGIEQSNLREKILQSKSIIQQFYTLTCQANRSLQLIFEELFKYIQKNKSKLINQGKFLIALQWAHINTFTMIVSVQRENYYECVLKQDFKKMGECFPFRYRNGVDEHFGEYRKRLEGMDIDMVSRLDVKQEFTYFQGQYDRYK